MLMMAALVKHKPIAQARDIREHGTYKLVEEQSSNHKLLRISIQPKC